MNWISVKDRLPKIIEDETEWVNYSKNVLIAYKYQGISHYVFCMGYYRHDGLERVKEWIVDRNDETFKTEYVTHWMNIRQPTNEVK